MFTTPVLGEHAAFRLQLFTAPGRRSVAVATQEIAEGPSLTNGAETYAAAVWRAHCPDEPEPPVWIQHHLPGEEFELVTFTVQGAFKLADPDWQRITPEQLAALTGGPVDPARGENYQPRPQPPEERLRYETMLVADLPTPTPFRKTCMPRSRGSVRGLLSMTRRRAALCCWYHGQDWATVSEMAIRLVDEARRDGLEDQHIASELHGRGRALGADTEQLSALSSLLSPSIAIIPHLGPNPSYTNGNHRVRAMIDANVHRTVVLTFLPAQQEGHESP